MSNTAWTITIAYTALSIIGIAVALIVFRSTRVGFHVRSARRPMLERRETVWGLMVITFLVVVLGGTIFQTPYFRAEARDAQIVHVTGRQFAWTIDPPRVRAGVPVKFLVRTVDVSHDMGVYDADFNLIKQVNVLPGTTQELTMTFKKPGTYQLLCLEFCGIDHHLMRNNLTVTR